MREPMRTSLHEPMRTSLHEPMRMSRGPRSTEHMLQEMGAVMERWGAYEAAAPAAAHLKQHQPYMKHAQAFLLGAIVRRDSPPIAPCCTSSPSKARTS